MKKQMPYHIVNDLLCVKIKSIFVLVIFLSSSIVFSQNSDCFLKYKAISALQNQKDSFEIAYNYCKLPYLQKKIQKLEKIILQKKAKDSDCLRLIKAQLLRSFCVADSLFKLEQYDLAFPILRNIMQLKDEQITIQNMDYIKVCINLTKIYEKRNNQDSALFYFSKSIDFGNQEIDGLAELTAQFYPNSKSFYMPLLDKFNKKLFDNNQDSLYTLKTLLRVLNLSDQIPRWLTFGVPKNYLPPGFVSHTDSLNQAIISYLIDNNIVTNFNDLGMDIRAISTILLNSPYSNPIFFEKYFSRYASSQDYNFKITGNLAFLLDIYLNCTRKTQCYGLVRDRLSNGKYGSPPIENRDTINKILIEKLKIDPKYIQDIK